MAAQKRAALHAVGGCDGVVQAVWKVAWCNLPERGRGDPPEGGGKPVGCKPTGKGFPGGYGGTKSPLRISCQGGSSIVVIGVTAQMGEGKSYCMVSLMRDRFMNGLPCASNIKLNEEAVTSTLGGDWWKPLYTYLHIGEVLIDEHTRRETMHPDDDPWSWPEGDRRSVAGGLRIAIIIDESGEFLDPDLPGGKGRVANILSRMRHSDKWGQDWYLVVQDPTHMHRRARKLVRYWWFMRDMKKAKIPMLGFGYPPPKNLVFEKWVFFTDFKTRVQRRPDWIVRDKQLYGWYQTESIIGEHARHVGTKATKLATKPVVIYPLWIPAAAVILAAITCLMGFYAR
jgi:hypothetical protein